jgi:hypothetical protein
VRKQREPKLQEQQRQQPVQQLSEQQRQQPVQQQLEPVLVRKLQEQQQPVQVSVQEQQLLLSYRKQPEQQPAGRRSTESFSWISLKKFFIKNYAMNNYR